MTARQANWLYRIMGMAALWLSGYLAGMVPRVEGITQTILPWLVTVGTIFGVWLLLLLLVGLGPRDDDA